MGIGASGAGLDRNRSAAARHPRSPGPGDPTGPSPPRGRTRAGAAASAGRRDRFGCGRSCPKTEVRSWATVAAPLTRRCTGGSSGRGSPPVGISRNWRTPTTSITSPGWPSTSSASRSGRPATSGARRYGRRGQLLAAGRPPGTRSGDTARGRARGRNRCPRRERASAGHARPAGLRWTPERSGVVHGVAAVPDPSRLGIPPQTAAALETLVDAVVMCGSGWTSSHPLRRQGSDRQRR
jgi:hypothetical protein